MAWYADFHAVGFTGGAKRVGEAANGMPRYLFTVTVALASSVAVPTTAPESMVTVGEAELALAATALPVRKRAAAASARWRRELMAAFKQQETRDRRPRWVLLLRHHDIYATKTWRTDAGILSVPADFPAIIQGR